MYSKKICAFPIKHPGLFEGMYGLVGRDYFHLLYQWCVTYYPYHWQYLKTQPEIKGITRNGYSRCQSMKFVRGDKRSKLIHHHSSIAWYSLCTFILQNKSKEWMKINQNVLQCLITHIESTDLIIKRDPFKK